MTIPRHPSRLAVLSPALLVAVVAVAATACSDDSPSSASNHPDAGVLASGGSAQSGTGGVTQSGSATASGGSSTSSGGSFTSSGGASPGSGGSNSAGGSSATGGASPGSGGSSPGTGGAPSVNGWTQVWADEFDGNAIDTGKWEHEVDCWGGGNGEDQCYVPDAKNSFADGGFLHIVALKDRPSGRVSATDGNIVTKGHSSARLRTINKGDWKYGRIEARARLPYGQGLWPAIWMLPTDRIYGGWALSGEIDIMEAVNLRPGANEVHGTLHYGGAWPANVHTGTSFEPSSNAWEEFHLYAVEWQEGEIRWFVDDTHYSTQTEWRTDEGAPFPAPFDERFHLILNVAVGGQWPGPPNDSTTFPQELTLDFVRVYECAADPDQGRGCGTSDPGVNPL